ncbi:MAG TPA: universal stress protein [Bacteroidales bacterium]
MKEEAAFPDLYLIPINFSEASLNACYYALEMASKLKARIKLIHAYGLPDVRPMSFDDTEFYAGTLATHITEIREEAEKNMASFLEKITAYSKTKSLPEIPITTNLINGVPDEIALYTAESEKPVLIIMGVSGMETRTFEPMGKIASRIVEKSAVPVLIIPEDMEFKGINEIKNVLYTTAFDETDFSAIGRLISIVQRLNMDIYCVHIGTENNDPWDKIKMEGLKEYFNKAYGKTNVECDLIFSKDIIKALDNFITEKDIDLLSLTTKKRNLISKLINPSIALKILYHTRIPLLVFHG